MATIAATPVPPSLPDGGPLRIARLALGAMFVLGLAGAPGRVPAADWPTATAAEAGLAADLAARLDAALEDEANDGLHAVVLVRDGRIVYERYLEGDDELYGRRKSGVVFGPDLLHDVRSISKSVVSLLYGIALADGTVPPPDAPVLPAFPEYADLAEEPGRAAITVHELLAMTMGTEWDEELPYSDPKNSEIAMNRAPDSLRYVLDRPLVAEPGTRWTYNGGATEVAAALIARGNGGDFLAFAEERLFAPLGITEYRWITDYYDRPHAASGLRLRPRDTARIGQLVLDGGVWNGERIVPAGWIETATAVHAEAGYGCDYGYQWWLCPLESGQRLVEAAGWGGQELLILPELDLVLVVNAGLYGDPEAYRRAFGLLEGIIIPSVVDR